MRQMGCLKTHGILSQKKKKEQTIENLFFSSIIDVNKQGHIGQLSIQLESLQRLPAGNACIAFVVRAVNSVASTSSKTKCLTLLPALGLVHLRLSLDE
jgi:hypothetical protein